MKSNVFSDIDLLILSDEYEIYTREVLEYKSILFEVFLIPKNSIYQVIELDKEFGIYISIIEKGKIIFDVDKTFKKLKELILNKKLKPSPILRRYYIESHIKELLNHIKISSNKNEKELLLNSLVEKLIDLRLLDFNITHAKKTKHKYNEIVKYDKVLVTKILEAKTYYLKNESFSELLISLKKHFKINNILSKQYVSNQYFINKSYNNELVIYIEGVVSNTQYLKEVLPVLVKELEGEGVDFYSFEIKNHFSNLLEKGYYLIIYESDIELDKRIIPYFNRLVYQTSPQIFKNLSFIYPYQIDISSFFGIFNSGSINVFKSNSINVSNFIRTNYTNENILLLWFINYVIGSYISSGISKNKFTGDLLAFGNTFGHSFLNVDRGKLDIKREFLRKTYKNYLFNKENQNTVIINMYNDLIKNWNNEFLPESKINSLIEKKLNLFSCEERVSFIHFISKVFLIDDSHLIYIFHIIGHILEELHED